MMFLRRFLLCVFIYDVFLWFFISSTTKNFSMFLETHKTNKNSAITYKTPGFLATCVFPVSFCCAIVSTLNKV